MASSIKWGTGYENGLFLGDVPFDPLSDREPRDGSEFAQGSSGVEDAWITGRDYVLDLEARWIPYGVEAGKTTLSGPVSWQHFLDSARDKNPFRFVPDLSYSDFYVDGCYLVEPLRGFGALSSDIKRNLRFKIRNPTVDFMQALRGIMFEYAPGASLTDPVAATYSRATVANRIDKAGLLATEAAGTLRDRHYEAGVRTTLLEASAINVVIRNRDLANAAWVKSNMTAARNQVGIDGVTNTATLLTATAANATCLQSVTLASSVRYQTAYVKRITGSGTVNMTQDNGATWTVITLTTAFTRLSIPAQTLTGPIVGFRIVTSGDEIVVDYVQNETGQSASSPIETAAAAVTRNADSLSFPFSHVPQAMAVYVDFTELGTGLATSAAGDARILQVGKSDNTVPKLVLYNASGGTGYHINHNTAAGSAVVSQTTRPALFDRVELLALLYADGSVKILQSINGGAETGPSQSAPLALAAAWSDQLLWLNSVGTLGPGWVGVRRVKVLVGTTINSIALARAA